MTEPPFRVQILPAAQRQFRALPASVGARVRGAIVALGDQPRPVGAGKIQGTEFWRLRIGDLRIIFAIDDTNRIVSIERIARRSESTYRRL